MQRGWVRSDEYRSVIETIIEARRAAGVTQRELARRLRKPPSFVNKIELFERRLDVLEFVAIAMALAIEPDVLMKKVLSGLPSKIAV